MTTDEYDAPEHAAHTDGTHKTQLEQPRVDLVRQNVGHRQQIKDDIEGIGPDGEEAEVTSPALTLWIWSLQQTDKSYSMNGECHHLEQLGNIRFLHFFVVLANADLFLLFDVAEIDRILRCQRGVRNFFMIFFSI